MPRIRRWHPVSHDLVGDPEFQELLNIHPRLGYVWLQFLSVADRNGGRLGGDCETLARHYGYILKRYHIHRAEITMRLGIDYMRLHGWIEEIPETSGHMCVRNYAIYHKTRGINKSHVGIDSVPSELTNVLTNKLPLSEKEGSPAVQAGNGLPDWFKTVLKQSPNFSPMLDQRYAKFWAELGKTFDPYEWLAWDEQVHKADAWITANPQRKPRNLRRFVLNWFNKAVDMGRIQRAKEETANRR